MPETWTLATAYIGVLVLVMVAVTSLIQTRPKTRWLIRVLFVVLALLVFAQIIIIGAARG